MDEQDTGRFDSDVKIGSEVVVKGVKSENPTSQPEIPEPDQVEVREENSAEVFAEPESGSEVITIVAQENDGQIYIYEGNENEPAPTENATEFIQVCDSDNAYEEVKNSEEKEVDVDGFEEDEKESEKEAEGNCEEEPKAAEAPTEDSENADGGKMKNYKTVILEDWEVELPRVIENHESENYAEAIVITEEPQVVETQEVLTYSNDNGTVEEVTDSGTVEEVNENSKEESSEEIQNEEDAIKLLTEKKLESLKYPKSISKDEIVKILDESTERVVRPIVTGKDLFFSIELTKRLNQKLTLGKNKTSETVEKPAENESCNNNNTTAIDDRQKIVDILEAEEIKDWKSVPTHSDPSAKENGNDMEISNAIKNMEEVDAASKSPTKSVKKSQQKKVRTMDRELERTIALQQLREEFPSTRKRSKTTKKVNHIPFLASTVLEKALTSPEVTTALKPGLPKRRPCYLPENVAPSKPVEEVIASGVREKKGKGTKGDGEPKGSGSETADKARSSADLQESDSELSTKSMPNPVVKTYSAKRKSTDAENDIKSTLETIAAVTKALNENAEETGESKPKKQKTVIKSENKNKNKVLVKKKKKLKSGNTPEKKMNSELEKLLGDEGAVRMLYDTQHLDSSGTTPSRRTKFKTTTGLKKDLVLKTKLVKNAVMRLSGVGADGVFLRGQRRSHKSPANVTKPEEEPLFSSTPNIVLYKAKKKQRAEASRILYRHSSSESFDSSEGYRRTSFDADGLNVPAPASNADKTTDQNSLFPETEKSPTKTKPKKGETPTKNKLKRLENVKKPPEKKSVKSQPAKPERLSTDSMSTSGSKLNLSVVPVRKSSRPRTVSKKYSIWSSTSMDSLSVATLGLKKMKKPSTELGKKLNCKELTIMQYENLVQVILTPGTTLLRNSLDSEVLKELHQVFSYLSEEESCRVVLISSRGNTFCQGVDINRIISFEDSEREKGISLLTTSIREFITCLAGFNKPIIAGVHGAAVGLGVTLLSYCDLVISSDTASFFTPYVKLGQAPEGAPTHTFPRISRLLVSELLFKSHKMTAADALKHGLVTQIIPEERFEEDLIVMARNLAAQSVEGMQSIKFLLRNGSEQEEISEALQVEGELLREHWKNPESLKNMVRFLNSGELQLKQPNS